MKAIAIDIKELKNNIDYYIEVGKKTIIEVTKDGKRIFTIVPERLRLLKELESFFDSLPEEAYDKFINKEISRE